MKQLWGRSCHALWILLILQACQSSDPPQTSGKVADSTQSLGVGSNQGTSSNSSTSGTSGSIGEPSAAGSAPPSTGGSDPLVENPEDAAAPAGRTFSVTGYPFEVRQVGETSRNVLTLSRYGRLSQLDMRFNRAEAGSVILSTGRILVAGGYSNSALAGTQRHSRFEHLGIGNEFSFAGESKDLDAYPKGHSMAPLPGGKLLMLGGDRTDRTGTPSPESAYNPMIIDPEGVTAFEVEAAEAAAAADPSLRDAIPSPISTSLSAPAAGGCGGYALASSGKVMMEPFSGSIADGSIQSADAQWKIGILKSNTDYFWVFDTLTQSFRCYPYAGISSFDTVRMTALPNGNLFIWSGANSKVFDPLASGGAGELREVADPLEAVRIQAGVVALSDGKVAVIGGLRDLTNELTSIEVYDPTTDRWTLANATLRLGRYKLFPRLDRSTGEVVLLGGHIKGAGESNVQKEIDAWNPVTDTLSSTGLRFSHCSYNEFPVPHTDTSRVRNLDFIESARSSVSGSIYWAGNRHYGSPKIVGYESGLAPRVALMPEFGAGPVTVEVVRGIATLIGSSPTTYVELEVPIENQPDVTVKLTNAEGATGVFTFSTEIGVRAQTAEEVATESSCL